MRNTLTIMRREMNAYFLSPVAYIIAVLFLIVNGTTFYGLVALLRESPQGMDVFQYFFEMLFAVMLLGLPMITMRLYAEEKNSGTVEVLMTAPVTDRDVVLGKYLAVLLFYVFMWLPTLAYIFVFRWYSDATTPLDWGLLGAGYLGVFLAGMLMLAIGFLCSTLTKSQLTAAIAAFLPALGFLYLMPLLNEATGGNEWMKYFSMVNHIKDNFAIGWIDLKYVVFYLTATAWVLFLTIKVVESRKWK